MGEGELHDKLLDWVETSGRALELRTARLLHGTNNVRHVNQSVAYEDPVSKQQREGDVRAVFHWRSDSHVNTLQLSVECKSSKAAPWVGFYDDIRVVPDDMGSWCLGAGNWSSERQGDFLAEWMNVPDLVVQRAATHAVSALGKDSNNQAGDALRQAVSFARAEAHGGPIGYNDDPDDLDTITAFLPVVVTQAPLFTCELDPDGKVLLTAVEGFDAWVYVGRIRHRVYVRSEGEFERFVRALDEFVGRMRLVR